MARETAQVCYTRQQLPLTQQPSSLQITVEEVRAKETLLERCNQLRGGGKDFYNETKRKLVKDAFEISFRNPLFQVLYLSEQQAFLSQITDAAGPLRDSFYQSSWFGGSMGAIGGIVVGALVSISELIKLARSAETSVVGKMIPPSLTGKFVLFCCGIVGIILGQIVASSYREYYPPLPIERISGEKKNSIEFEKAKSLETNSTLG